MANVELVRIPLNPDEKLQNPPTNFNRMPIMYLELLENKDKVKPEMVGTNYEPPEEAEDEVEEEDEEPQPIQDIEEEPEREAEEKDNEDWDDVPDETPKVELTTEEIKNLEEIEEKIHSEKPKSPSRVPTLTELQSKQPRKIKPNDYKYPQEEDEQTIKERNDVFFHYEVLRRMHPNAKIPEFSAYSDPKIMAQKYEFLAKKLSLESSVENWKRYMIIFVMGCEVVLGKLNFDMEGFAQQQIISMNTYDQLLVELAEKSYTPSSSKWPVEVRLLMTLTMNIVLFMVSKMIMKKTGTNLLGAINGITSLAEPKLKDP
jgi:hypothetical protein